MADGDIKNTARQTNQAAPAFFGINGSYLVAPDSDPNDLLNDVGCFAECAEAALQAIIDGMSSEGSQMQANPNDVVKLAFGIMYHVKMMANLANAAIVLQPTAEVSHG